MKLARKTSGGKRGSTLQAQSPEHKIRDLRALARLELAELHKVTF